MNKTTKSKTVKRKVTDEHDQRFILGKAVGEGGQGIVFTTDYDNVLVKMSRISQVAKRQRWLEHVRWLIRQPLEKLNVAKPISCIEAKNHAGYVMELMDGLTPLQQLMDDSEQAMAETASPLFYLQSGGIKRRMTLMAKLARTLADLHGRGLAYGDLSPANIFVSGEIEHNELWLIDCDNICLNQRNAFDSAEHEGRASGIYSPGFGAPEVISGDSLVSSLTDSWSFAVIAFKLLTTNHPFIGDLVNDGEPELEADAFNGKLPWVYHSQDHTNEVTTGIPLELVALKPLIAAFARCFEAGKADPFARPSMSEWAETFERLSELLVDCQNHECRATYRFLPDNEHLECPFCPEQAHQQQLVYLRHFLYDATIAQIEHTESADCYIDTGERQILNIHTTLIIKSSPPGSQFWLTAKPLFHLKLDEQVLLITPCAGVHLSITRGDGKPRVMSQPVTLQQSARKGRSLRIVTDNADDGLKNVCWLRW